MTRPPPATVFVGGVVLTGDPSAPRAPALACRGARIVAVGAEDDVRAVAGPRAAVVDLAGGALLPGFRDGHVHPIWAGLELAAAPVRDCGSVEAIVAAVRAFAAMRPDADWITGGSYDAALAPGGRFDARWLDGAAPGRPVYLESADHHCAWVNSPALERAGVTAATPDPPAGVIARRADGTPLGTLVEWTAMELVSRHVPPAGGLERAAALRAAIAILAAAGVVWAQDAAASPADVATYLAVAAEGALPVRMGIALRAEPGSWPRQRAEFAAARALAASSEGAGADVVVRTVKFFADGVIEAGTAALLSRYADADSCGLPVWEARELAAAVAAFDADGFQVHIHAIGDAAVRTALDAIEHTEQVNGARDRRPVLAHVQLVDPVDLGRFGRLGVIANLEPVWAELDSCQRVLTIPRLGADRSARQYPARALLGAGAVLSFGSDWPVSTPSPLAAAGAAAARTWLPDQRLEPALALAASTLGPAYQAFEDAERGRLLPGQRADLVYLAAAPDRVPPQDWHGIAVRGSWVDGVSRKFRSAP